MGANKFVVNAGGSNVGPFDFATIISKVKGGELNATDQMCEAGQSNWVMICQHPDFASAFQAADTASPSQPTLVSSGGGAQAPDDGSSIWFILKNGERFGPFPYGEIIKMLQDKNLFEFDYVWREGMEEWLRVAELSEFSTANVREYMKGLGREKHDVFYRRKHPRSDYECEVIAHDNSKVWRGKSVELSQEGAAVVMENATLVPGQNVYLHFRPGPSSRPFNVLCEIVSKRYQKVKNNSSPIVYGIKFINITKSDKDELRSLKAA